jgi:hypothetical protein
MKKVLFSIASVAAGLFVASCGNKSAANGEGADSAAVAEEQVDEATEGKIIIKEKTREGEDMLVSAEFTYPTDQDIKVAERGDNGFSVTSEKGNWKLFIHMHEYGYDEMKERHKKEPSFKELKIGNYDAWYDTKTGFELNIFFENVPNIETIQRYASVEVRPVRFFNDGPSGLEIFESNEDVKALINTVKYLGTIKK